MEAAVDLGKILDANTRSFGTYVVTGVQKLGQKPDVFFFVNVQPSKQRKEEAKDSETHTFTVESFQVIALFDHRRNVWHFSVLIFTPFKEDSEYWRLLSHTHEIGVKEMRYATPFVAKAKERTPHALDFQVAIAIPPSWDEDDDCMRELIEATLEMLLIDMDFFCSEIMSAMEATVPN